MEKRRRLSRERNKKRTEIVYPERKVCSRCRVEKSAIHFSKRKQEKDGLRCECRGCAKLAYRSWYETNSAQQVERAAHYNAKHPDRKARYAKTSYRRHIEVRRETARAAYLEKKDGYIKRARDYYRANRTAVQAQTALYRVRNAEAIKERQRLYRLNNRPKLSALSNLDRARRANAPGSLSLQEWEAIKEYFGFCCAYCLRPESECGKLARDHLHPMSLGGTNYADNIVPACKSCNSSKNNRTLVQWTLGKTLRSSPQHCCAA